MKMTSPVFNPKSVKIRVHNKIQIIKLLINVPKFLINTSMIQRNTNYYKIRAPSNSNNVVKS